MEQINWGLWLPIIFGGIQAVYTVAGYYRDNRTESQGAVTMRRRYVIMGVLLLLTWAAVGFDYYDRRYAGSNDRSYGVVDAPEEWGILPGNLVSVVVDTARLTSAAADYYLVLAIRVADNQVDQAFDRTIEKSQAFLINGGRVRMEMKLSDAFIARLGARGMLQCFVLLMPRSVSIEQILSLADVTMLKGRVVAGGGQWVHLRTVQSGPPS